MPTEDDENREPGHLMTAAQLARTLGVVSHRVIAADMRAGRIKSVQIGARRYVPRSEIDRLSGSVPV